MVVSLLIVMPKYDDPLHSFNLRTGVNELNCCRTVSLLATVSVVTLQLTLAVLAALAEEFTWLPERLRRASSFLAKNRSCRHLYICVFISIIFTATVLNVVRICGHNPQHNNFEPNIFFSFSSLTN